VTGRQTPDPPNLAAATTNGGEVSAADRAILTRQLGRPVRGLLGVGHRCPCGQPDVVLTAPRLDDGTPFPTYYYLTCPRATAAVSTLESRGVMAQMSQRLAADDDLAARYRRAHETYLRQRRAVEVVPQIDHVSAGGMPERVKCLHALLAHTLACGPGVNPFGDEVRDMVQPWWTSGPCASEGPQDTPASEGATGTPASGGTP
jgi:hypothetical protein